MGSGLRWGWFTLSWSLRMPAVEVHGGGLENECPGVGLGWGAKVGIGTWAGERVGEYGLWGRG